MGAEPNNDWQDERSRKSFSRHDDVVHLLESLHLLPAAFCGVVDWVDPFMG